MLVGYRDWKTERFRAAAGGKDVHRLLPATAQSTLSGHPYPSGNPLPGVRPWYYLQPDSRRDSEAKTILQRGLLHPINAQVPYELWANCSSSSTLPGLPEVTYRLTFHPSGSATCTCRDWLSRGGACKHLRAFRFVIESWAASGYLAYAYPSPASREEAIRIDTQNQLWYGAQYERSLTLPCPESHCDSADIGLQQLRASTSSSSPQIILPPHSTADACGSLEHELAVLQKIQDDSIQVGETLCQAAAASTSAPMPSAAAQAELVNATSNGNAASASDVAMSGSEFSHHAAVALQIRQQVHYDVVQVLPVLHGLHVSLSSGSSGGFPLLDWSPELIEFRDIIGALHEGLKDVGRAAEESAFHSHAPLPPQLNLRGPGTPDGNSGLQTRQEEPVNRGKRLRAPSPERKQKRKKSFKTM
ncbi:hypothetical protein OH77DRAFT_1204003 [Trametes cingulata]|nr:hypothetical protein OH77DRAFT_1204003 [Trametes cingulata]